MKYMESPKEREYIKRIKELPKSTEKRVISFGLYGDNPKYTTGAIRNAELRDTYFPGWVCRFYVDDSVPKDVIVKLEDLGSEIVHQKGLAGATGGMFWRFLVADDPTVDRYIVRDSDSRLNARDRFAVEEWIESSKCVHNCRDHVNHVRTMNGGMWGGRKGCIPGASIEERANNFGKDKYMQDIYFLERLIWPLVKDDQMSHDAYSCAKFPNARPFPTQRDENYQHVGQVFDEMDAPRMSDIDGFIRGRAFATRALSSNYCVKHWTVVADVDELLMYHSCESVDLKALSKVMSARDQKVLNTFLLDVYPKGPLSSSSSDASKHEYFDYDESVPSSQRNPPNFALKDGFYDCHKELTEHCKKTMVRVRIGMADRNFVYSEKVGRLRSSFSPSPSPSILPHYHSHPLEPPPFPSQASFFKFSKKMSIFPGHHRVSVDSRMLSNSADSNYKQTSDVDPLFYDYRNKVQGVVIHRLFVTIDHRTRYLPDSEYKERVRKVIDDGRVDLHRQGVTRRVGDSTGLPYLGGAERQAFIAQASGRKD